MVKTADLFEEKYGFLHSNQKLLIKEFLNRGIEVEVIDSEMELILAKYKEHIETILDRDSSIMPYSTAVLVGDKMLTKNFLRKQGISVPIGKSFMIDEEEYIVEAFKILNCPVVIKPCFGSHGENVHTNLQSLREVRDALNEIRNNRGNYVKVLIEEYFKAKEYRVFMTRNGEYAVLHRDPASVIGDGKKTIEKLAEEETYRRTHPRSNALCPILVNEDVVKYLRSQNLTLASVPLKGAKIYLRDNSNVAAGGLCIDYTEQVHPSVLENCLKVFDAFPNLPYAGIDYMSLDITQLQRNLTYRIIEVNSNPGIHMHMNPAEGLGRNISSAVTDLIFPETRKGEVYEKRFKRIV